MKFYTLILSAALLTSASCQTKPIKTIFETSQKHTATALKETKIYFLQKQTENSDFDYSKLDDIDGIKMDALNETNLLPIFEPVSGRYNFYQFLSTSVGEAYHADEPPLFEEFHDILIIKTDRENKILDAYHYTLEWAEPPLQYDVFKSSIKNISLTNNMDVKQLKFVRTGWDHDNEDLNESGIIRLR